MKTRGLLLGLCFCLGLAGGAGAVDLGHWEVVKEFGPGDGFTPTALYPLTDQDIWVAGYGRNEESVIYHYYEGQWIKEEPVPDIGKLAAIAAISPNKGWALGDTGLLEYDGIFWTEVEEFSATSDYTHKRNSINVVDGSEVWLAVRGRIYKYTNGSYENIPWEVGGVIDIMMRSENDGFSYDSSRRISKTLGNGQFANRYFNINSWTVDPQERLWTLSSRYIVVYPDVIQGNSIANISLGGNGILEQDGDENLWVTYYSGSPQIANLPPNFVPQTEDDLISFGTPGLISDLRFGDQYGWAIAPSNTDYTTKLILKGTKVYPDIALSSPTIAFEDTPYGELPEVNQQTRRTLTIRNTGEGVLHIYNITGEGEMFRFQPTEGRVAPGDSLNVFIVYLPTTEGRHTGKLTIESTDPDEVTVEVALSGVTRGSVPPPRIEVEPTLSFINTLIGESREKSLTIRNAGESTLSITSIRSDDAIFSVSQKPFTISRQSAGTVDVTFSPRTTGEATGTLTIASDDPGSPSIEVRLSGVGELPPAPQPVAGSGTVSATPAAPLDTDSIVLSVAGDFANSGAIVSAHGHSILNDRTIAINITTEWSGGVGNEVTTPWRVEEEIGSLDVGEYAVEVNVNGERFASSSLRVDGLPRPEEEGTLVRISPINPTKNDEISIYVKGDFPYSNAAMVTQQRTQEDSLITIDLVSRWEGEETIPTDTLTTGWSVLEQLDFLDVGDYRLVVNVNGEEFKTTSFSVREGEEARGLINIDFNMAGGDQQERALGNVEAGSSYEMQIILKAFTEISGWSAVIEYDPTQVRYVEGSFEASDFIPGLTPLVDSQERSVSVGGAVLGTGVAVSGTGVAGMLSFEVLDGFTGSAELVIVENNLRFEGGGSEKYRVDFVATLTEESVEPPILGDFNNDGKVDFTDFFLFADAFGKKKGDKGWDEEFTILPFPATPYNRFDLNSSEVVDFGDFFIFADNFGREERGKLMQLAREYIGLPDVPYLEQNFPNPFNAATTIRYRLTASSRVEVDVFDLSGQRINRLVDEMQPSGEHEVVWDGGNAEGRRVSTGIYLVRLHAGEFVSARKMMLAK